eukprot:Tbor_TRINITY_DN5347_c0_g1::TRINITY_DN5347_c0_g1_i17::g.4916::m.4916
MSALITNCSAACVQKTFPFELCDTSKEEARMGPSCALNYTDRGSSLNKEQGSLIDELDGESDGNKQLRASLGCQGVSCGEENDEDKTPDVADFESAAASLVTIREKIAYADQQLKDTIAQRDVEGTEDFVSDSLGFVSDENTHHTSAKMPLHGINFNLSRSSRCIPQLVEEIERLRKLLDALAERDLEMEEELSAIEDQRNANEMRAQQAEQQLFVEKKRVEQMIINYEDKIRNNHRELEVATRLNIKLFNALKQQSQVSTQEQSHTDEVPKDSCSGQSDDPDYNKQMEEFCAPFGFLFSTRTSAGKASWCDSRIPTSLCFPPANSDGCSLVEQISDTEMKQQTKYLKKRRRRNSKPTRARYAEENFDASQLQESCELLLQESEQLLCGINHTNKRSECNNLDESSTSEEN